jgi:HSP20 family protein
MTLIRWKPMNRELAPFANWLEDRAPINRIMDEFFGQVQNPDLPLWGPNVDIVENKDAFEIHAELPGVKQEDVQLTLDDNTLVLSGEKKQEVKEDKGTCHRVERTYGKFQRSFSLPNSIQPDKVNATFEDGVLRIVLPKAEQAKPRSIQIESIKK